MAEIRVAPQRRSRAVLWVVLLVLVIAAIAAWYFLAGPGAGASTAAGINPGAAAPTAPTGG